MKYVDRQLKGTYGYVKSQLIFEIIKTVILFVMAFGIYIIGYVTLGTNKSLWSVIAVLAMLPACKSLVGVIMLARYRSLSEEQYDKYSGALNKISVLYENIITTSKKSYFLPVIACENNTLIGYCTTKTADDVKILTEHLKEVLKIGGHKSVTVKIFNDEDEFLKRANSLNDNLGNQEKLSSTAGIFETLKAVSL